VKSPRGPKAKAGPEKKPRAASAGAPSVRSIGRTRRPAATSPLPAPSRRDRKRKAEVVLKTLRELYPDADCELLYRNPLELLVATILSAQSTDKRVNLVTRALFEKYRSAQDYAGADPVTLAQEIHSTGFFRNKTKSLIGMGKGLVERFGGEVPRDLEQLVTLPGVARKTANVVLGTAYGIPSGFVVDTHVKRVAWRLGLTDETDPEAIEQDLMGLFPRDQWIVLGHALIWHGRRVCHAHGPDCDHCGLAPVCLKRGVER
jgi:endonuclease-3